MASASNRQQPLPAIQPVTTSSASPIQSSVAARAATMSPTSNAQSNYSIQRRHTQPAVSPTERSFFGALTQKVRDRSRSRSRNRVHRSRSQSPVPAPANTSPAQPPPRPNAGARIFSDPGQPAAPLAAQPTSRKRLGSGGFQYYGRHGNQWLFNDFSVRETAKELFGQKRRPS